MHHNKLLLSIECKRTEQARNSKEMVEQVQQYYGSKSKKGYFQRHIDRGNWLVSNLEEVSKFYKINLKEYRVISFFVTYEILAIQFITRAYLKNKMNNFRRKVSEHELDRSTMGAASSLYTCAFQARTTTTSGSGSIRWHLVDFTYWSSLARFALPLSTLSNLPSNLSKMGQSRGV